LKENNINALYSGIYVFEGIDNVGKTTIINALKERLCKEMGCECATVAFPGNEERTLGALVYDIHHHEKKYSYCPINDASLQLLHVAAHIDLIQRKLMEEYSSSKIIMMDRFWWSTYAYGLSGELESDVVSSILSPELIYWEKINVNKIFLIERKAREKDYDTDKDVLIMQNYRELARKEPKCQIINNDGSLEETINMIFNKIVGEWSL
jgi:dTMP kinase